MLVKPLAECRAVLFVNQQIKYDPATDQYSSDYTNLIDFLFKASSIFKELHICLPVGEGTGRTTHDLPANVRIIHLPFYHGPTDLLRSIHRVVPRLLHIVRSEPVRQADIIGTVAPSTLGAITVPISYYVYGKPHFLLMRGDKRKTVAARTDGALLRSLLIGTPIKAYDQLFGKMSFNDDVVLLTIGDLSDAIGGYGYDADSAHVITPLVPEELLVDEPTVSDHATDLLYVGRLSEEKAIDDLLRGFQRLDTRDDTVHLHVVGSGPSATQLKQLAAQLGITDAVTFHGFVPKGPDLWAYFDDADIFVLPSQTEGLPRVVAEAMARGLPVVTTAVGGLPELIDHGRNGMLVDPRNVDVLMDTIETVREDANLRFHLATEGQKTATQLTFEANRQRLLEILSRALCKSDPQS
ncbi:glycosyltransferase [Haloarcula amylolytica]|uniref:Group 1 glycosyl transferase n=1 Tax=Haloarcula amylolytica JCM 13557 TaxID=1227452 RepID=M0K713_9EURY|nr:glycosyltransferase [Haloarcula amylolytica]EMA15949.1 group 1 glycosyl transferase [Haloarcula amylolytica JCM 13557]